MAESDLIRIDHFDTAAFAPRDRHEAWKNQTAPAIGVMFDSKPIGDFSNASSRAMLGDITLQCSTMAAQQYERTAAHARGDDFDQLLIPITLSGSQRGEVAGRSIAVDRGGLAFVDLAQPQRHVSTASRTIMIGLSRAVAEQSGHRVHDLHGLTIAPADAMLLRRHACDVKRLLPKLTVRQAAMLGRVTIDLIEATLSLAGIDKPISGGARETAQLVAARAMIADLLDSPTLTVTTLARKLRLSRSTLYRLFEEDGGVLAYIRRQRLIRVRDGLSRCGGRSRIADLAERWGFSDAAHLSRQFRREFGVSPSEFREEQVNRSGAPFGHR